MKLAIGISTPFFKAKVLKLSAEAYELVNLGAVAFYDDHEFDDDDEDNS
jgi:hypothetical protein